MCDKPFIRALKRVSENDLSAMATVDRRDALGVTAGAFLATLAQLPTTPVDNPVNYYVATHEPQLVAELEAANNKIFINTVKAQEVARNIYLMRYRMLFDPQFVVEHLTDLVMFDFVLLPKSITNIFNKLPDYTMKNIAKYYF